MIDDRTHMISAIKILVSLLLCLAVSGGCSSPSKSGDEDGTKVDQPTEPARWRLVQQELPSAPLSVQVVSNGDVYAVGSDAQDGRGPYVLRFDGERWTRLPTGAVGDLWWVHEIGPDEILMCGANRLVLSFRPSTGVFTPVDVGEGTDILYGIWGLTRDDIWAVGGSGKCGVVLHYDGASWTELNLPEVEVLECVPPLFKVWGTQADRVWMVGGVGATLHYDGSDITFERTHTGRSLLTVHGDTEGELIVAVGGAQSGEIRELIDDVWTDVTPPGARQMLGVNVGPSDEAVAVGIGASTMRRGEDGWFAEENGLSAVNDLTFHAVWVDEDRNAWAVGGSLLIAPFDRGMVAYYGTYTPSAEIVNGR